MTQNSKITNGSRTEKEAVSRRDFLKIALKTAGTIVALEVGGVALSYFQPRAGSGGFGGVITVGLVDDFPLNSVTPITQGRFYLSRLGDGGFLAIYQRCTHLGCTVPWDQAKQKFVCPCHSAEYDDTGEMLSPPAPRSLDLFAITIEDNHVLVDTSQPLTRDHYDSSQVVYA